MLENNLNEVSISLNPSLKSVAIRFDQNNEQKFLKLLGTLNNEANQSFNISKKIFKDNATNENSISSLNNNEYELETEETKNNEKQYSAVGLNKETRDF